MVLGALGALGLLGGCGNENQRTLGTELAGPFAVAPQPGTRNVFVLNSAFSGLTSNGSLVRFELDVAGKSLTKRGATSVPRLGRDMMVSPDGKLLVASFADGSSRLKFFSLSPDGGVSALPFEVPSQQGLIGQLQFLSPRGLEAGQYMVSYVEDHGNVTSNVVVAKITAKGASKVLRLPDDLPDAKKEDYDFGYTAPAFEVGSGLFVAFPQGPRGTPPEVPSALAYTKGSYDRNETDLRFNSLVVVDLEAFLAQGNIAKNAAFFPLLYNTELGGFDLKKGQNEGLNDSAAFRASFSAATGIDQGGCLTATGATPPTSDPKVAGDAVLVVDESLQEVLSLTNWVPVREALEALEPLTGARHKERLLPVGPKFQFYSRRKDVKDLDSKSRISRLRVVRRGNDCVPVWLRVEQERASQGNELSRLQANFERAANNPVKVTLPVRGSTAFGVLSLGSGAATRAFVFTTSYSFDEVRGYEYKAVAGKDTFVPLP